MSPDGVELADNGGDEDCDGRVDEDPEVKGHFNQTRVKWREVDVPG